MSARRTGGSVIVASAEPYDFALQRSRERVVGEFEHAGFSHGKPRLRVIHPEDGRSFLVGARICVPRVRVPEHRDPIGLVRIDGDVAAHVGRRLAMHTDGPPPIKIVPIVRVKRMVGIPRSVPQCQDDKIAPAVQLDQIIVTPTAGQVFQPNVAPHRHPGLPDRQSVLHIVASAVVDARKGTR